MGTKVGLTLKSETYPEKDNTWTIKITAIWDNGRNSTEEFTDPGYLDKETAEKFMVVKTNLIKELMEKTL